MAEFGRRSPLPLRPLPDEAGWEMVFDVQGEPGTLDYAEEAFQAKLAALAADQRVRGMRAVVLSDGVENHPLVGERPRIVGYQIAAKLDAAYAANAA